MSRPPAFEYDPAFTPSRPRKKRKNKTTSSLAPLVVLERTRQELVAAGEWTQHCTSLSLFLGFRLRLPGNHYVTDTAHRGIPFFLPTELVRDAVAALAIRSSPKALCLGLGSPSASRDARAQLAFLLQVCDDLALVCILFLCTYRSQTKEYIRFRIPRRVRTFPCMILRLRPKTIISSRRWTSGVCLTRRTECMSLLSISHAWDSHS